MGAPHIPHCARRQDRDVARATNGLSASITPTVGKTM
jgi:hypothetical protein